MGEETVFKKVEDLTVQKGKGREPVFVVLFGEGAGKTFRLKKDGPTTVGRSKEADITLNDTSISRKHAEITTNGSDKVAIIDLNSTNGTFVNGNRVKEANLQEGDKLQLGDSLIHKFSFQDVLEEAFQENLYKSATQDSLTGIYNKKFFVDTFSKEFSYNKRGEEVFSLIMFDIDHFKKINDAHGHLTGDYVLRCVAQVISRELRTEDIFCRYGGEEFTIILKGQGAAPSRNFAERIRKVVCTTKFEHEGKVVPVSISIGIATFDKKGKFDGYNDMIKEADSYLYKAKDRGRNQVCAEDENISKQEPSKPPMNIVN